MHFRGTVMEVKKARGWDGDWLSECMETAGNVELDCDDDSTEEGELQEDDEAAWWDDLKGGGLQQGNKDNKLGNMGWRLAGSRDRRQQMTTKVIDG
ncbi:hypothetical protein NDU88_005215 [Pleurodeles waltl]|uniref:Uncharacterized protein n=1 Tax=Pleurodeles waltl TaxID=8319 RepID=A0AAV7UKC3_PLEWA|nr:hypothetical protein NDU88_005215 [Pleurodeles waltl]